MTNKEQYILFSQEKELPLQMQPWWLDAVCGPEKWDVCLSFDKENKINGALPYYYYRKYGVSRITMPPLTDYIGPKIEFPNEDKLKRVSRYSIETRVLNELVSQLPPTILFYQTYLSSMKNSLPFTWSGFRTTTFFTYQIQAPIKKEQVFSDFKYTVRTEIRKAGKKVRVDREGDLIPFFKIYQQSFERKGLKPSLSFQLLENIDLLIRDKAHRRILLAKDRGSGEVHAGLYLVRDAQMLYILMTGIDPHLKSSGALYLLYWQAIILASELGIGVDFCGSILPGVENSIRSMGGERVSYFCVSKTRNKFFSILNLLMGKAY